MDTTENTLPTWDIVEWASFISSAKNEGTTPDSTYSDFFQETSDGNISIWPKAQKSGLEVMTNILSYIVPIVIVIALFWVFHVFIRSGWAAQSIKETYTFLCPYLSYGVNLSEGEKNCQTLTNIRDVYSKKRQDLEWNIINKLAEYIPIKITKNLLITSPERNFVINTYKNKIHMDEIMNQFENARKTGISLTGDNVICNGISIIGNGNLTTQCTIYGWLLGDDDENGKLGSARVEALRFLESLSDTSKSKFILLNPPSSLSMEVITGPEFPEYKSRTTLSIQLQYVPFTDKP